MLIMLHMLPLYFKQAIDTNVAKKKPHNKLCILALTKLKVLILQRINPALLNTLGLSFIG